MKPLNEEGVFLVWVDEDTDDKVLFVKHKNSIVEYKIMATSKGSYSVETKDEDILYQSIFNSMEELLLFYSSKKEDVLCTKLEKPCVYTSEWEIKVDEIALVTLVKSSGQTEVWRGFCGKHAIQCKKLRSVNQQKEIEEVEVLKRLDQQNIAKFHGVVVEKVSITIITEGLEWSTLKEHYTERAITSLPINICISVFRQVLNGLAHLQERRVVHLSFGARNILFSEMPSLHCKITNFSQAKRIDVNDKIAQIEEVEMRWLPPEAFEGKYLHKNCDVWSFGVFIHELFTTCDLPYSGMSNSQVAARVKGGYQIPRPDSCPEQIFAVARECMSITPDKRPSFESLQPRMRQLTVTLTVDGRPIPAPRRNLQQSGRPVPKPRKRIPPAPANQEKKVQVQTNYENREISPQSTSKDEPVAQGNLFPETPRTSSLVPLISTSLPSPPRKSLNSEYQIKRKELKLVSKVRKHLEDEVWEGVWKGNIPVLVTVQTAEVPEQIEILKKLKNENVVKLLGLCMLEAPVYLLTEIMKPGSLLTFLRGNKGALEDEILVQLAVDIAKGMAYLHSHFVIHRDLRADTILLDENNTCKIAHFNYVKRVDEATHTYTAVGIERIAVKWAAPEAITNGVFSTRSDVWSFGIILYEIVTNGAMPYPGMKNADTVTNIAKGYRMEQPDSTYCPDEAYQIMLKCWDQKPDSRPSSIILPQTLRDLTQKQDQDDVLDDDFEGYIDVFGDIQEVAMDWSIELSDLAFLVQEGPIWKGKFKNDTLVAIRCIDVQSMEGEIKQRVEVMKELKHDNILELCGVCTTEKVAYIVTEFMKHGNLHNYLEMNSNTLTTADQVSFSWQVSKGMAYLEEKGIIHGNFTAVKVLIGGKEPEEVICKVSGMFGTEEDKTNIGFKVRIPPRWMAPETAVENVYLLESDVWAFGVVLYEIMTCGIKPFSDLRDDEVLDQVIRGHRMLRPTDCKDDIYSLMLECWNEDPSRRPSFETIATKLSDVEMYEEHIVDEKKKVKLYADLPLKDNQSTDVKIKVDLQLKVAESATGDIWRGTWKGIDVAVKYPKSETAKETLQSFELMKSLANPNILRVLGLFSKNQSAYVVMDFMCRGNLQDYIAWEGSFLALEKQIEIAIQCAKGMSYLERHNIIHGNLSGHNVLVGNNMECKITGIRGNGVESEDPYSGQMKFYKWMALESLLHKIFSTKSDSWSYGILLYEIMTHGEEPYHQWSGNEAKEKIQEGYRMPCPPDCPDEVYTIMMGCWNENPSQRPPFSKIERKLEDVIAYDSVPVQEDWPWNIRPCDLSRKSKVADSEGGEVWRGVFRGNNEVAVLCPTQHSLSVEISVAELMKSLKHPHILSIFGICSVSNDTVWICTEMMMNGNLKNYIQREKKTLSVQQLVLFSAQCASGMLYLEEKGIVHGNLTARQILVSEDLTCKITGISGGGVEHEDPYEGNITITFFLPIKWRAPETIRYYDLTVASDVWSFGIVLYEIMSYGRDPYAGMSNQTALREIDKGHHIECPPNSPREIGNLLIDCWAKKPENRPKFDNITLRLTNLSKFMTECEIDQLVAAQNSWEIKQSDLVFEEKLASGKSGDIWKGVLKETKQVAIQVVIEKDEEWIQAMLKLKNPNILGVEAVCYTQQEALIVTELMENDNIVKFLRGGGRSLKLQQLMHIAVQVSQGMVYLKNQQVVHRDLCARNVLVGDKMLCKITGILGDWVDEVDDPYYEGRLYTPPVKWAAPEAALYGRFTYQSDVWSFGIVLYEIVTYGRFPYPGMTRYEVISKIQDGYRMPCPSNCHETVYGIMRKCWQEQPEARNTTENLNEVLREFHQSLCNAKNEWEVEESDVKAEEKIGESELGEEIWRGKFRQKPATIKYHSVKYSLKDFVHETEVLQTLSHQNVIQFHGFCPKGKTIFMVLGPVKSCNLLQHIRTSQFSLSHGDVLQMAFEIVGSMAYLHKQGIIHRNLSASNIVIGENNKCKISNFQQALMRKQGVSMSSKSTTGKVRWMAVEVLSNNQYSMMSDVWSYGILLYELATQGQTPYPDLTDGLVCLKVPSGHRMSAPPGCPTGLFNIMANCWQEIPCQRPSSDKVQGSIERLLIQNKKWETSDDQVVQKQSLGQEKYVEFWKCQWRKSEVVVKYHKQGTCSREIFLWEAEVMKTLEHPNIVKLLAVCTHTQRSFIVLEAMGDTLYAALRRQTLTKLSDILSMTIQVAKGMLYLQEQRVIHRSLMARNILVKDKTVCKISNFSEAIIDGRELTEAQRATKLPIRWIPPESSTSNYTHFSLKTDVWSFGVLLHEIFTRGTLPYNDIKDKSTVLKKLSTGYRMPCPEACPQSVYRMMLECWNEEPGKRPTFQGIQMKFEKIQDDLNWEIDPSEMSLVKLIDDTGRFGEVWEGEYKKMPVAVKYHKSQTNTSEEFLWEAELLKTLKHPYVIKLIGLNSSEEKAFMVVTYMKHGTLNLYLKTLGRSQTLKTLLTMGTQVADGMAYLQTQKIIHRDLAARSILVGEDSVCMISDFSEAICTARNDNPEHQGRKLPAKWLPPEAVVNNVFDMHTDIWSYGILLYEIVTFGGTPYKGMTPAAALTKVWGGYRMPMPSGCPGEIYDIMMDCWRENPSTRPTFETVHLQMQRISKTCKNSPLARSRTLTAYDVPTERRRSWTESHDPWEIDRYSVTLDTKHEEGRFGEVWKGYLKGTELVAIKIPKLDRTTALEFLHESEIMKMIEHSNVVSLKGVCTKGEPILIITEFMANGNLVKYLRSPAGRRTAQSHILKWATQICNGMMHLEKCRIIHRDVAARNILLGEQLVCKISDFGLAQKVSGETYKESSRTQFPLKWMAPESISQRIFSVKSDVWSFGILLCEMVTHGALPYPGVQNPDIAELVKAGYRMPCPRGCPKGLHEIMDSCWKERPEERPNFPSINTALSSLLKRK